MGIILLRGAWTSTLIAAIAFFSTWMGTGTPPDSVVLVIGTWLIAWIAFSFMYYAEEKQNKCDPT